MLPGFLFPSYKQYKTDSNAVASWLANTAQQHGYPKDLLSNPVNSQQKAPKLKGRARKLARDAAQRNAADNQNVNAKSTNKTEDPKYLIALDDFISLAEWLAAKIQVKVPANFVSVLDRAITVRKRHHNWWYRHTDNNASSNTKDEENNERHGYFIGILERVREILRPRMPPELLQDPLAQPTVAALSSDEPKTGHMANLFANLDIEEPSDASLGSEPAPTIPDSASAPQEQYSLVSASDVEEVYFAAHCLFNDLDNIRKYLQQVWKGYKQGAFDLVAASITTNTAIEVSRQLQEDFTENFPKHSDFEQLLNVLFIQICLANNEDPRGKEYPDDEMNFAVYEEAESILFPAYMLISSFSDIVQPNILPSYKPGYFGSYDASSDRASKSARDKFREDKVLIMETLPDFCALSQRPGGNPAEDELIRGMRDITKDNRVFIWLAFAAQIFLDINHVLRDEADRGHSDLVRSAKYFETNIQQVLKFHEKLRIENWPRHNDGVLIQILNMIEEWVKTDIVEKTRRALTKRHSFEARPTEPFMLFKRHPLFCGLLSYNIKILAQDASIIFVNAWGAVMYCAHLYNALRQEKLISNTWKDMDLALLMHRKEDLFVGGFPTTVDEYFTRFALAMGYSASMFANNRRRPEVVASKAGPRSLNDISPVSKIFRARYCGNEIRTHFSPDDIDTILTKYAEEDADADAGSDLDGWTSPRIKINEPAEQSSALPYHPRKKTHTKLPKSATTGIRPIHILNALLNAVQSETLELTFDHFRLHTFCWRLLRQIKERLHEDLREYYGPGYLEKENQLPFTVGYIFMTAVATNKLGQTLLPKKKDVVTSRLLVKAAEVVKEMLDSGAGAIEMRMLKEGLGIEVEVPDILAVASGRSGSGS